MIGAIAGDIIGSVYEWENIKTKDFDLFSPDCCFTDDTVLTGRTIDAIQPRDMEVFSSMGAGSRRPALQ